MCSPNEEINCFHLLVNIFLLNEKYFVNYQSLHDALSHVPHNFFRVINQIYCGLHHYEAMALVVPIRKMGKNLGLPLKTEDFELWTTNMHVLDV